MPSTTVKRVRTKRPRMNSNGDQIEKSLKKPKRRVKHFKHPTVPKPNIQISMRCMTPFYPPALKALLDKSEAPDRAPGQRGNLVLGRKLQILADVLKNPSSELSDFAEDILDISNRSSYTYSAVSPEEY
eukprot:302347_1